MGKNTGIIILIVVGAIALFGMLIFGGGLLKLSTASGSASGTSGSGGSGLLNSGGAGGLTSNPSITSTPSASGSKSSSSAIFGSQTTGSINFGSASSGAGGLTINNEFAYAPVNEEQAYTNSTYAPVTQQAPVQQTTQSANAPNTGFQLSNPFLWWTSLFGVKS